MAIDIYFKKRIAGRFDENGCAKRRKVARKHRSDIKPAIEGKIKSFFNENTQNNLSRRDFLQGIFNEMVNLPTKQFKQAFYFIEEVQDCPANFTAGMHAFVDELMEGIHGWFKEQTLTSHEERL